MATTIETLTVHQVWALEQSAARAGDELTVADCYTVLQAYADSFYDDFAACIDGRDRATRDAAKRIVEVIRNGEAQS